MKRESIVYVVDDDVGVRKVLVLLFKTAGYQAKACGSAKEFVEAFDHRRPGCLVLDVRMPEMSGLELQEKLVSYSIDVPVIIITGHADVAMAVKAFKTGAVDFIEKPFVNQVLLNSVERSIKQREQADSQKELSIRAKESLAKLSSREYEVMLMLADGKHNKEVATALNISVRTAEGHRAKILHKLDIKSMSELTRLLLAAEETLT